MLELPVSGLKVPTGQAVHLAWPSCEENEPEEQGWQLPGSPILPRPQEGDEVGTDDGAELLGRLDDGTALLG